MNGDLARDEVTPHTKETQLARQTKRYHRKVASPKRWESIADAKQGPCRVCQAPAPNELHHLIPRSQGGSDTESNIVPLCREHHASIEARNAVDGRRLAESLTDTEYAFVVDTYGEDFFERRLGVKYERAA